jgi:tRNA (adenine22-N1)-methyltransferase
MKKLNLKGRLSLCAEYVREGSRLADIGTDHGYLPIALCESEKIPSALACDINPLPLESARKNITEKGLSDVIQTRLSDGLKEVGADEADDIVIAGMGGELISAILGDCAWVRDSEKNLILQPMTRHDVLTRWLYENGFRIEEQGAVYDSKKYYTVMRVRYDGKRRKCGILEANIGRLKPDNEASVGFLNKCLNKLKKQEKGDPRLQPVVSQMEELLS